jgi:spoIIIJ-associated protein
MKREVVIEAPTVEEAIDAALEELGVQQDAVGYEVESEPGRKMFGLGGDKIARVRVWLKEGFVQEIQAVALEDEMGEAEEDQTSPKPDGIADTPSDLTDEELDKVADEAVLVIQTVVAAFGLETTIEEYEGDEDELILDVVGEDLGVLIGRHGRTLDAMQTLVSAVTNRRLGFRYPVLVDVEGYRNRRRVKLDEIGRRAADRAERNSEPVKLRPMSSYERKVIHMSLRDDVRVTTSSEGDEPFRQVVVSPK